MGFCGLDDLIVTQPAVSLLNGSHNTSLNRFAICLYFSTHLTISCHVLFVQLVTFVYCTHTHTPVYRPFFRDYPGEPVPEMWCKTNLDFTEARDSEWQWHQPGHMQICTLLQRDNHASTVPLVFLQAGCPSCCPTNNVKALKANFCLLRVNIIP